MRSLRLSHQQVQFIVEQAQAAAPYEVCGLIAGKMGVANHLFPIPNRSATPEQHYDMEPNALLKTYKDIDAVGEMLLAVYHSHPKSDPIPSQTDIRDATRHMPNVVHLIVSLKYDKPRLQAWYIHDEQVSRAELLVGNQKSRNIQPLSKTQVLAIVLAILLAVALLLTISISLLPPAPPIPTPQ
jgi:proteasome lid subunit RPN8/RPN11